MISDGEEPERMLELGHEGTRMLWLGVRTLLCGGGELRDVIRPLEWQDLKSHGFPRQLGEVGTLSSLHPEHSQGPLHLQSSTFSPLHINAYLFS